MSNEVKQEAPERITISNGFGVWQTYGSWKTSSYSGDNVVVEYVRADLLATVRREEREAAFKLLCPDCAEGDTPTFDQKARWCYHGEGQYEVGCSASKLRIAALESSANSEPDEPRAHILKGEVNG